MLVNDDYFGRCLVVDNFLRGTKYEEWSRSEISMEVEDLIDNLDPKSKRMSKGIQLSEILYRHNKLNKTDYGIRMLIAAYIIYNDIHNL